MVMAPPRLLILVPAACFALAACQGRIGNDVQPSGNGSAANKAEEGQLSISAPGVEMKIDIPEGLRREANIQDDSGLVYPGSRMSGIHIEGGRDEERSDGEVEMRFAAADPPATVARWYQDPARVSTFTLDSSSREGEAYLFAGTKKEGNGRFRLRLSAGSGGGTDGRLLLTESAAP
jgi:hypothetical protein